MLERKSLNPEYLSRRLEYYPDTGDFVWKELRADDQLSKAARSPQALAAWNACWAGKPAFANVMTQGYLRGCINYVKIYAHRAAWAYVHGDWPDIIDHINRDKTDNRTANLRPVEAWQNANNCGLSPSNRTGHKGIFIVPGRPNPFRATVKHRGKVVLQRQFATLDQALEARDAAIRQYTSPQQTRQSEAA